MSRAVDCFEVCCHHCQQAREIPCSDVGPDGRVKCRACGAVLMVAWPGDLAAVSVEMLPLLAEEAAARQKLGKGPDGSGGRGRKKNLGKKIPQGFEGRAAEQAAAITGANSQYVAVAAKLAEASPRGGRRQRCIQSRGVSGPCSSCQQPMGEPAHLAASGATCAACCPICGPREAA